MILSRRERKIDKLFDNVIQPIYSEITDLHKCCLSDLKSYRDKISQCNDSDEFDLLSRRSSFLKEIRSRQVYRKEYEEKIVNLISLNKVKRKDLQNYIECVEDYLNLLEKLYESDLDLSELEKSYTPDSLTFKILSGTAKALEFLSPSETRRRPLTKAQKKEVLSILGYLDNLVKVLQFVYAKVEKRYLSLKGK